MVRLAPGRHLGADGLRGRPLVEVARTLLPLVDALEPAPESGDDIHRLGRLLEDVLSGPRADPVPERLARLVRAMTAERREDRPSVPEVQEVLRGLAPDVARPPRVQPEAALRPPPRARAVVVPAPTLSSATSAQRTFSTATLLGVLAIAALGVFVILPRWLATRPPPTSVDGGTEAASSGPAAPRDARDPSAAAPPTASAAAATSPAASAARAPAGRPESRADPEGSPPTASPGEAEWSRAMSEGLAALDRGEFAVAQIALARAEAARPGTAVVADAMRRADEGRKVEALTLHRARGASAESREDWRGALAEYDAASKVDPQVAFALEGRARSLPRAELDEMLAGYLQRSERLSAEAVAREAERALDRAAEVGSAGPRLQQQRAALERLLQDARTPVDVRLVSDGRTEVVVLRVGTLGRFHEQSLRLRPGSYVVVGRRPGYRDTRKTLVVSPTPAAAPLDVRCDEAL